MPSQMYILDLRMTALWDVTPSGHVKTDQRCRDVHCLYHRWQYTPLKRRSNFNQIYSVTAQKAVHHTRHRHLRLI